MSVAARLEEIAGLGRDRSSGGYRRLAWTDADLSLREWFTGAASDLGLDVEVDRNGNLWAWWGVPGPGAIVTGSHVDSVPDGGNFDGPLGIASAFEAIADLRRRGVTPTRPVAVACFTDEEGGRFGIACVGSRLAAGVLSPERALALRDADGVSLAQALERAGRDPRALGPDPQRLADVDTFIELHVEQGRGLIDLGRPVAVGTAIIPHGRWRVDLRGEPNHAGTTRMADRHDPMTALASLVLAAQRAASDRDRPDHAARATVGRVRCTPNAVNAVPSEVIAWLDARAASEESLDEMLRAIGADVREAWPYEVTFVEESRTPSQSFDAGLAARMSALLDDAPLLDTGAGHDAGVLAEAGVRSAMLFVRNPTGVSHSPEEHAEDADCEAGAAALADVLADLIAEEGPAG